MKKIKVIVYGCGVMGRKMAEALWRRKASSLSELWTSTLSLWERT